MHGATDNRRVRCAQTTAGGCGEALLRVPLHARYPPPANPGQQRGQPQQGAAPWAASALAVADLTAPRVLVRCRGLEGQGDWQEARIELSQAAPVRWAMPAGNTRHGPLVAVGTAAALAAGAAALLAALFGPVGGSSRAPARCQDG